MFPRLRSFWRGLWNRPQLERELRALAAADELDDFVAVAGLDLGLAPFGARQNLEVALDGDAPTIQR